MRSDQSRTVVVSYLEAAEMLSVSERTVWQLVRDKKLKALRIGRAVRIPISDIERFVKQHSDPESVVE